MRRRDKKKGRIAYPGRYKDGKPARRMDRELRDTCTTKLLIRWAERQGRLQALKMNATRRKRLRRRRRRAVA